MDKEKKKKNSPLDSERERAAGGVFGLKKFPCNLTSFSPGTDSQPLPGIAQTEHTCVFDM